MIPWIIYVSGKLPTYPSPKPTLALTSHLGRIHQMIPWIIIRFWFSFTDRTGSHSSGLTTWLPEKSSFQMTDTRQLRTTMASARWVVAVNQLSRYQRPNYLSVLLVLYYDHRWEPRSFSPFHRSKLTLITSVCETARKSLVWALTCLRGFEYAP